MRVHAADYELCRLNTAADAPVLCLDGTVIEVVKVGHDDRYRQSNGQYAGNSAQRSDELSEWADRQHVSVPNGRHRYDSPPERVRYRVELRLVVFVGLGKVDGARKEHDADEQEEDEQTELSQARADRLPENLEPFRVPRQLEYTENADEADDPEDGEGHGTVTGRPAFVGNGRAKREEVRRDGDDIDDVHGVAEERDVVGRRCEPDQEFDGEPDDAHSLDNEERLAEQRHVVVMFQHVLRQVRRRQRCISGRRRHRVVCRCVDDTEAPITWQCLEAKDDN